MGALKLLAISAVSTFVPGLPEGTLIYYVQWLNWNPFLVALLFAFGQCVVFALLYRGGEELVHRWAWLGGKVAAVRHRFEHHLESRFLFIAMLAAVVGIPPAVGIAALGDGFGVPFRHLMPVMYVGRVARFLVLIFFGAELAAAWHHFGL